MVSKNQIQHVIIIIKENHTFDNYFGTFPGAAGASNLAHAPDPPASDPPHDHAAWLNRAQRAVRAQYQEADIPAYFAYARLFTLCDNYFTDIASQSEPNHLMLIAADSPIIDNSTPNRTYQPQQPFDLPSLPANLTKAGFSWATYGDPTFSYFDHITTLKGSPNIKPWTSFDSDVAGGKLATVTWIYAQSDSSEHPPYGKAVGTPVVKPGMEWTVARVNAIAKSKFWSNTAIFITWDDWGGWYDHVDPQQVETWAGNDPARGPPYRGTQFQYGSRVPCLVISPYARKGHISTAFHSHVSLVKFCEKTFGLPSINARDAGADDMSDCFDFTQAPLPAPAPNPGGVSPPSPNPITKPKTKPKLRGKPTKPIKRTRRKAKKQ